MATSDTSKKLKHEPRLVEVHGSKLNTTSLIIANNCGVTHRAVIQLIRKFKADLQDVGRVAFQMRTFETKGGIQEQEIAILDDYAAMLLLTHMRSNETVRKFKLELVREFKRMAKILNEPNRKTEVADRGAVGSQMTDMLKFIRESAGKETASVHCMSEHLFCNRALTGQWKPIDYSEVRCL